MKHLILYTTSLLLLVSCIAKRPKNLGYDKYETWEYNERYSANEKQLITAGKEDESMRIWLITNKEDSVLLRTKSKDINLKYELETTQLLSKRLTTTVQDPANAGVGIAAPQVGILKNMIVVQRYDKEGFPFETYINPVIKQYSKKTQFCLEGCLSIPKILDTTHNRAYAILLEYDKLDGTHEIEMVEAFTAVIFQHEIDHLNGILFTDHLDLEIKEAEERIRKEKKK